MSAGNPGVPKATSRKRSDTSKPAGAPAPTAIAKATMTIPRATPVTANTWRA